MEENFTYFLKNNCLICEDNHLLTQLIEKFGLDIISFQEKYSYLPKIFVNESQPVRFLAAFIAAHRAKCHVFLCNPNWGKNEWLQVFDLVKPDIIWGQQNGCNFNPQSSFKIFPDAPNTGIWGSQKNSHIMIPTGGSSGKIKFAAHTWETLTASVRGFKEYFQVEKINSFCILPLYHVSGLMQFMRCLLTGGKLVTIPFKALESSQNLEINHLIQNLKFFISLVPTQLERLLQNPDSSEWLGNFHTVLLGGAPAWDELLQKARFHNIRVAPTYGMTETASQIATMKADDFLRGKVGCGHVLPHATVKIMGKKGKILPANQVGSINIEAQSLALGYYPLGGEIQTCLQIDDLAFLDEQGYLNIVGRNSDKIITGGENVYPVEVEAAIRATSMVVDVCVIGVADKYWGEVVTAIYVGKPHTSNQEIKVLIQNKLSSYKIPKFWIAVNSLPRNSQGKINRQKLDEIAAEYSHQER